MNGLGAALGDLLPAALGIALSPLPIIASVLMLLSARAKVTAPAFAAGWILGLSVVVVVVLLVAGPDGVDTGGSRTATSWIKLALGVLFLVLAVRSWRQRPRDGVASEPPGWMRQLDSISPLAALGLGALLAGLNPKNLALAVSGAVSIAASDLTDAQTVVCAVLLVVLGSTLVVGPVVASWVAHDAMATPLAALKRFMEDNNAIIMTVLLGFLGLSDLGKGLGGLLG